MNVYDNYRLDVQNKVNAYFQTRVSKWKNIYARATLRGEIYRARHAVVLDWIDGLALKPGARLLEIGCGAGFLSIALAKRGFRVNAIDSVESMIEQARLHAAEMIENTSLLSLDVGDVNAMAFEDNSFDLVVGVGVIPWLERPELAMQEVARVTKPNGYVILTTDNRAGMISLLDPVHNPMLTSLKQGLNKVLGSLRHPYRIPVVTSQFCYDMDDTLAALKLYKVRGKTLGFGPFTFFNCEIIPERVGKWLHRQLQCLAERNVPVFRSIGKHYIILTMKSP